MVYRGMGKWIICVVAHCILSCLLVCPRTSLEMDNGTFLPFYEITTWKGPLCVNFWIIILKTSHQIGQTLF